MAAVTAPCAVSPVRRSRTAPVRRQARPAAPQRPLTLTRRGRLVVSLLVVAAVLMSLVAVAAVLLGPAAGTAAAAKEATTHMTASTLVVRPGDTLWSIATRVAPNADPRETITALREVNNLAQPVVYVGQRLIIPTTR
jgi:hypothetical protein